MEKLYIICIDDQREVLSTLEKDLETFEDNLQVEACETAEEAWGLIEDIDQEGDLVALVISDHVMPGKNGVTLLTEIYKDNRFQATRKILLTGQATHKDTIVAINEAKVDQYFEKPWDGKALRESIKELLTHFIIDQGLDYEKYMKVMHQPTLLERLKQ